MQGARFRDFLQLHLIVFIWGFTGVLGGLISLKGTHLVWYRMLIASVCMFAWLLWKKVPMRVPAKARGKLMFTGLLIAIHWVLFFTAIKLSNVSVTLAMFSMGAFFAAIFEPLFYGRKMLWYEVLFGLIIIGALSFILRVEFRFLAGMICALVSVFFGVLFTLMNGKLTNEYRPDVITLYEFATGFICLTVFLLFEGSFFVDGFFTLTPKDFWLLLLLASVCTAFAFTASVQVMRKLSPYTVLLTTNLEPVYGIGLAFLILGDSEHMSPDFYIGAAVIVAVVLANGYVKRRTSQLPQA